MFDRTVSSCLILGASLLAGLSVHGAEDDVEPARVNPRACVPTAADYGHTWWAEGFPWQSGIDAPPYRCVQTGVYGLVLDVTHIRIPHLGRLARPAPTYAEAVRADNRAVMALPPADLDLVLTLDGHEYRCVRGGEYRMHSGPRLVESGRYLQRLDVTDLVFEDAEGVRPHASGRLEIVAWPERLAFLVEAVPERPATASGPSFGRVGGGWAFDGGSCLEEAPAPELEPQVFTLELWYYTVPSTGAEPHVWLYCQGANEWEDGNFGLMLQNGVPVAVMNVGGGRESVVMVQAHHPNAPHPDLVARPVVPGQDQWHHLAMTYDGERLQLFVNGEDAGSATPGTGRRPGNGALAIGGRQDNSGRGYRFHGILDEIRLYDRVLGVPDLEQHVAEPARAAREPGVVRAWSFAGDGEARTIRPSASWERARLSLRVTGAGHDLRGAAELDHVWTAERPLHAAVVLPFAPDPVPGQVTVRASRFQDGEPLHVEHDVDRGWFRVDLDTVTPLGEHNDVLERVPLVLENRGEAEAPVRLLFDKTSAGMHVRQMAPPTGVSPILRDAGGEPLGIPVQISKNWHSQADLDLTYQGMWLHGFSMLRLPPHSRVELEFSLAYAHWGGVAAASHAQLCLIGWSTNQRWDQAAVGCWGESICFEPDQIQAAAAVLDVRPLMVHSMASREGQPVLWNWTHNVGGADFLRFFAPDGERLFPTRMKTAYHRYGPVLTEVTYAGLTAGGRVRHCETVSLYRTDDLTRGLYRVRMEVLEPVRFSRFVVFQVGADSYSYTGERQMAVGNADGMVAEWATQWGGEAYRTQPRPLAGEVPWVSLHQAVSRDQSGLGAWANRGIVVREWQARVNGEPVLPYMAEYGVMARGVDTSTADVLLPPEVQELRPGDVVEALFEHVIIPQAAGEYYGPNQGLRAALERGGDTWQPVQREAVGNRLEVEVGTGVLESVYPVRVRAVNDAAQFQVTGGRGYVPVTIAGLTTVAEPILEIRDVGGEWATVDQAVHGKDFWQADPAPDHRLWEVSYSIPLDTPDDLPRTRRFRFRAGQARRDP
jgi:hypothetical protein